MWLSLELAAILQPFSTSLLCTISRSPFYASEVLSTPDIEGFFDCSIEGERLTVQAAMPFLPELLTKT
jgi:hypothetical protein